MVRKLTEGGIASNIISFSLPYLFAYFLQTLYGMADLYIAGQFNGADVISAIAIGSQLMHMVTVIIVGLAMGSTVMISRAVGAGDDRGMARLIGNTVTLFAGVAILLTALLLIFKSPIVYLMSTPPESVLETRRYLAVCFAGIPFIIAYNVLSSVFRGMGDSKSPMFFIAVACAVNIALDYLFMGAMGMGATGAALGTVLAQAVSVATALIATKKLHLGVKVTRKDLEMEPTLFKGMLSIGFPIAIQDGFVQVSFLLITVIANRRGVTVAAAVGIVEKIICFLFLIPSSMLSSVSAIATQNIGAKSYVRARKTLLYGTAISAGIGFVFSVIFQFASKPFLSMFTSDSEVIRLGEQYLRTYVLDCIFAGIHFPFSGFFSAMGMSMLSFIHNITSILLVRIPGAYFASKLFPQTLYEMGLAAPAGSLLSSLICIAIYVMLKHKGKLDGKEG
ncbi:MAG: MATE family efflux transporter [Treponema sp.]|nr:MATE family efflux transporter [Treponema sp.]